MSFCFVFFFFFKQKTAYEMRISDWSSDVCSSDLPVCYDPAVAPDLLDVAGRCKLTPEEVAARHAGGRYFVYMLGFMPGLAYMGGLDAALQLPRRREPRLKVPQGSVAIAESMTKIYPWESPGGWHLIGRTPLTLFDAGRDEHHGRASWRGRVWQYVL